MADILHMKCDSPGQMDHFASVILEAIGDARVIVFYGQLGAGKTTLIKALCRQLGVIDVVTSPTFSIVNEYRTILSGIIYHFDFYRINQLREVFDVGYEEYFYSGNFCFMEWPEKVESILPPGVISIHLEVTSPGSRLITLKHG